MRRRQRNPSLSRGGTRITLLGILSPRWDEDGEQYERIRREKAEENDNKTQGNQE